MEEWKSIPENTLYDVSSLGNVRRASTGQILKQYDRGDGYKYVMLHMGDAHYLNRYAHRLVACAFITGDTSLHVNHKDHNRSNNYASNLEWLTPQDNHAYSHGIAVQQLLNGTIVDTFTNMHDAATAVNGKLCAISRCCAGISKKHRGYEWQYAKEGQ